jgi:acetyl esterase/lipase
MVEVAGWAPGFERSSRRVFLSTSLWLDGIVTVTALVMLSDFSVGTPVQPQEKGCRSPNPTLSPINAPVAGLPPAHLHVGTRDLLFPDVRRLRNALNDANVPFTYIEQRGGRTLTSVG